MSHTFSKYFKLLVVVLIILLLFMVSLVFPVKYCLNDIPSDSQRDFYIVRYDALKNWWILAGDRDGLYDWDTVADIPVELKGNSFLKYVSGDLYLDNMPTYYIVWGEAEIIEEYNEQYNVFYREYIINCTDWNILGEIHSRNKFRMRFCKKYMTIYDYKWFDTFRKIFWI